MSTHTTSTFHSTSYSTSTSTSPAGTTHTHTTSTTSDPSGTTIRETSQRAGEPARIETTGYPATAAGRLGGMEEARGRIEDVTDADADADAEYGERMDDEYAKREGGT